MLLLLHIRHVCTVYTAIVFADAAAIIYFAIFADNAADADYAYTPVC